MTRLVPTRSPSAPGPGSIPVPLVKALEFKIRRRIEGLLAGDHRAVSLGLGTELAQIRPYEPGDDVRRIDWNVTARIGEAHVRVDLAEHALTTWILLDTSPSMAFGTADRRKGDVAEGVALVVGHVATRNANRLGIVTFGDSRSDLRPPRQGRAGMLGLLSELRREQESGCTGATSLAEVLSRTAILARRRGLVFCISDFRGPSGWRRSLLGLAARHDVAAIEVRDPREQALPDVADLCLVDPETGRQIRVDTSSPRLRERFAAAAAEERRGVARTIRSTGVDHLVLSTAGDWLRELVVFLRRQGARR